MRRLLLSLPLLMTISAQAADNTVLLTPCTSGCITMRSKDVGSGVESAINILGDTSGNAIYGTAGTANTNVLTVQGIASMTKLLVTPDSVALPANQSVNVSQVNAVTTLTGAGAVGTGSQRVAVGQDTTTIAGSAPGTAGSASTNVVTIQGIASMTKLLVTPDANSAVNVAQINGVTPLMGNGVTGTGSQRVTIASDNTAFSVNSTLSAETTKVIGTVRNLGNAGAITDFVGQAATAPANAWLVGATFFTTPTTLTNGQASPLQMDNAGNLLVNVKTATGVAQGSTTSGQTGSMIMGAVTTANPSYTTAQTAYASLDIKGNQRMVLGGGVPETISATGTTGATTATLATAASTTTYICGFSIRANATAAKTGNATVTGVITGTMNFTQWTAPNASGVGVTEEVFVPCIPASAANTSIAVVSDAPGTGGVVSVSAWGYQQ